MITPLIPINRKQAYFFAAFLVLYEFLTYIANDMIMPGMIRVVQTFHADITAVASALTAYILGGASLQIFLGPLSDRYGRRPVMLIGVLIFFIFTLFIAHSASIQQFISARFFQGMGLCFITVIGYATLQEIYEEKDAVRLIAVMSNVAILAPLLGPLAGALFIHFFGWRSIFFVIAGLSLLALWGLWKFMPEPIGQQKTNGEVIQVESIQLSRILGNYKKLLCNRSFIFGVFAGGILSVPSMMWIGLSPVMLIKHAGLSKIDYALWQIPVFGATILGTWSLHRLTQHFSIRFCFFLGSAISIASLIVMTLLPLLFNFTYLFLMPGLIVYFYGLGINSATAQRLILYSTKVSKGTASALMSLIFMLILALGTELANILYDQYANKAFAFSSLVMACVAGLFGLIAFGIRQADPTEQMT